MLGVRGSFWFSLHRAGDKSLDRIGKAALRDYRTLEQKEVINYVDWDIHENALFSVESLILHQGRQGVPIGGHISAQLAEIWAMSKEMKGLFGAGRDRVCRAWREVMNVEPLVWDAQLDRPPPHPLDA